ncbi:Uncharacterised protein [Yersinia enterocolitica]|nr:Uncharacterised protein [Yersinia enterocolitica]CQJ20281.1 Uncharacterised protein [Yersinia enterocolitica]
MGYLKRFFLAYDTVFVPRWRAHNKSSYDAGKLVMAVSHERKMVVNVTLY